MKTGYVTRMRVFIEKNKREYFQSVVDYTLSLKPVYRVNLLEMSVGVQDGELYLHGT